MFILPNLPYSLDALEPRISKNTLSYHYGKHHKAYIDNLNSLLELPENSSAKDQNIQQLIESNKADKGALFTNAAQAFNHAFYWHCMTPKPTSEIPSEAVQILEDSFGTVQDFKNEFTTIAKKHFGSGWAWLIKKLDGSISLEGMHDADTPLMNGDTPLLALDVWEHAYYLDYQNARPDYIEAFWQLINWEFVLRQYNNPTSPQQIMTGEL